MSTVKILAVPCRACGRTNEFDQPHPYHAGFGNRGFLYNEAGTATLVWSSFDRAYESVVGKKHPWMLSEPERRALEDALVPSTHGGRWLFSNAPRCQYCGESIGGPITKDIYYFVYRGSAVVDEPDGPGLQAWLREGAISG